MSHEFVSGCGGRVGGCWNCMYLFVRLLLRGSNLKKWDGHHKKKLFINNSVEDLSPFKEEYQGLLKLHVLFFGRGIPVWGKNGAISKKGIFFEAEKWYVSRLFRTYWKLVYLFEGVWRVLMKKKWGGNRRKRFYSEMWRNAVCRWG